MDILSPTELGSLWERLCQDPKFRDLGYKIEIQPTGKLIMSPGNIRHGRIQSKVVLLLGRLMVSGEPATEIAVQTSLGILVPDVCWCSPAWLAREGEKFAAETAPEVCIEIMSPSNSMEEMEAKRDAYFQAGCGEFILIDGKGFATFHLPTGPIVASDTVPEFPLEIVI